MKILMYLIITCAFMIIGCKKEEVNIVDSKSKVIKEYFHKNINQAKVFSYNNDGSLKNSEFQSNNIAVERFDYYYTNQLLTSMKFYYIQSNASVLQEEIELKYEDGKLTEINRTAMFFTSGNLPVRYKFKYATGNYFTSCDMLVKRDGVYSLYKTTCFGYDARGNIISQVIKTFDKGQLLSTFKSTFEYDKNINPKFKLDDPFDFVSYYSPNNYVKRVNTDEHGNTYSVNRKYEYNSELLPIKFDQLVTPNQVIPEERSYEYH